jgi:ribose/xylose/arabinose/galactoside ABC-type transport system permease subunit
MILTMASCLASVVVNGSPGQIALGAVAVSVSGLAAGAINAAIVVLGRIQPIIATLATGAIYFGIALLLRPSPGGEVSEDLSNAVKYVGHERGSAGLGCALHRRLGTGKSRDKTNVNDGSKENIWYS